MTFIVKWTVRDPVTKELRNHFDGELGLLYKDGLS